MNIIEKRNHRTPIMVQKTRKIKSQACGPIERVRKGLRPKKNEEKQPQREEGGDNLGRPMEIQKIKSVPGTNRNHDDGTDEAIRRKSRRGKGREGSNFIENDEDSLPERKGGCGDLKRNNVLANRKKKIKGGEGSKSAVEGLYS